MPPVVTNPKDKPAPDDEPEPILGPPEDEDLWERYNKRMEFPLATVGTVFLHVVVGAILVYVLVGLMDSGEDRSNPPVKLVAVSGLDDTGEGSPGAGGRDDADLTQKMDPTLNDVSNPPTLTDPKIGEIDPLAPVAPTLPGMMPKVSGPLGKGNDGPVGSGVGGFGADSTRARGMRWVLRFRVASGRDYLDQLKAMGAAIAVPVPPDNKNFLLFQDLNSPAQKAVSASDLNRIFSQQLQFSDSRQSQVKEVCAVLGVNTTAPPKYFSAYFPKGLEEELARKETNYRNRRAEDIEETIFRVTIRGGTYELVVDEQKAKK